MIITTEWIAFFSYFLYNRVVNISCFTPNIYIVKVIAGCPSDYFNFFVLTNILFIGASGTVEYSALDCCISWMTPRALSRCTFFCTIVLFWGPDIIFLWTHVLLILPSCYFTNIMNIVLFCVKIVFNKHSFLLCIKWFLHTFIMY